ncbi:hypothetical protein BY996DRAFT_4584156 [Phakopsora pachyrhizi]|uniref:RNA-binding S4 domain-containing protein n=1 Tax=Phakopsora pachyrhizi TaxID=170000 RepID=A0AAV0AN39_PHAPC|nr:hypothetical protein BY996DRAFT_4584156 [Phakopsora pachyrhizi]CAH7670366.1 hypothetical protein PPACK8108_LOCUS5063 [Phakopsora pachyrhizi]
MRKSKNPFNTKRVLPRMSWNPQNLFNMYQRTIGVDSKEINFSRSSKSVYWQRWRSKAITRAYHGDWIQETKFKRHYLPVSLLPLSKLSNHQSYKNRLFLNNTGKKNSNVKVPLSGLMFQEVERRLDVVVFRSCFADSIYEARRMVLHGAVKLNGLKCNAAWTRLHPGDLVTVNPRSIPMLNPGKTWPSNLGDPYVVGNKPKRKKISSATSSQDQKILEEEEEGLKQDSQAISASLEGSDKKNDGDLKETIPEADEDEPTVLTEAFSTSEKPNDQQLESSDSKLGDQNLTFTLPAYSSPFIFIPPYLEVSFRLCSTIFLRAPTSGLNYCEIPTPYDSDGEVMRLTWEWYTKQGLGRRIRGLRKEYDRIREMRVDPFEESHLRKNSVGGRVAVRGVYQGGKIGHAKLGSAEPRICPPSN